MSDQPTSSTTTITCNFSFITTPVGILKIIEIVLGLIAWACTAHNGGLNGVGNVAFSLFAFLTFWLITLITMGIYLTGMHATACSGFPWAIFETFYNCVASAFYFIGSCVIAAFANYTSFATYGAAAAFGFFTTIAYIVHFVFYFQKWRGVYPWQGCGSGGGSVQT